MTRLGLIWQSRWLNSDLTQIPNLLSWLNSDSTENPILITWPNPDSTHLSQSWVKSDSRLITFLSNLANSCWPGGGGVMRSHAAVGWFILRKATDKCKILTFSLQKNPRLNFDSSSIQLTQLWLKWRSAWFDSDSAHILDFHGRLNSDSTHLSQSRVKFDSRLMSRAQPWFWEMFTSASCMQFIQQPNVWIGRKKNNINNTQQQHLRLQTLLFQSANRKRDKGKQSTDDAKGTSKKPFWWW